jgi:hypothetical protein
LNTVSIGESQLFGRLAHTGPTTSRLVNFADPVWSISPILFTRPLRRDAPFEYVSLAIKPFAIV